MIGRWNPKSRFAQGRITEIVHVRDWRPHDRYQRADVVIDGVHRFTFLGQEPEEFFFRKPRKRAVDRDDVAGLKVGDYVSLSYLDDPMVKGLVTGLTVNPDWTQSPERVASEATSS